MGRTRKRENVLPVTVGPLLISLRFSTVDLTVGQLVIYLPTYLQVAYKSCTGTDPCTADYVLYYY